MPTQHVEPQCHEYLADITNALLKARKVVVITGAGISTNSGIPDFRSDHGLYSIIRAQFDAAARQARRADLPSDSYGDNLPPAKRQKVSSSQSLDLSGSVSATAEREFSASLDRMLASVDHGPTKDSKSVEASADGLVATPPSKSAAPIWAVQLTSSSLSSPPLDHLIVTPSALWSLSRKAAADRPLPQTLSPLSSPPRVFFESLRPSSTCSAMPSRRRSSMSSRSETDGGSTVVNLAGSVQQPCATGRNLMANMKGKDLFDARIWSDPIRTSVFYTFVTSLRQKIQEAKPSSSHRFISQLRDRGKLVRCYTQNIDQTEEKVGLSTRLQDGTGSRSRFSRRSTVSVNQLRQMAETAFSSTSDELSAAQEPPSMSRRRSVGEENAPGKTVAEFVRRGAEKASAPFSKRGAQGSGVECVFLHGSLDRLRCFLCGQVCSWDDEQRVAETMAGQQPECPHCVGATAAREKKGKRALGVGKLRPDIVLCGEEHPNSHLISPIVTHDLGLHPELLLILGTSLRVHGLKVMVREFAKAVHSRSGKVVFVNFTKPPESSWGDVIDYLVQWDCDAWVADLQDRIPRLWQDVEPRRRKRKMTGRSCGAAKARAKEAKKRPPAANPVALRDTKGTGAYWTSKVLRELRRITRGEGPAGGEPLAPIRKQNQARAKRVGKSVSNSPESREGANLAVNAKSKDEACPGTDKEASRSSLDPVGEQRRKRSRRGPMAEETTRRRAEKGSRRNRSMSEKQMPAELKLPPLRSPAAQQSPLPWL